MKTPMSVDIETFEQTYDINNNCFNFLRLVLASLVMVSHSYPLLNGNLKGELMTRLTNNQLSFGALAVYGFFIISGFLITQSLLNSKSVFIYIVKRALRIVPAFFASLVLIAFIIGPVLSHMDIISYFVQKGGDSPISFVLKNLSFNVFGYSWTVRDFTASNPFPNSANGSMWTLKHEVAMYLLTPVLAFFLFFRCRFITLITTVCIGVLAFLNLKSNFMLLQLPGDKFWVLGAWEYSSFIKFAYYFLAGSVIYIYKDKIYFSVRFMVLALFGIFIGNYLNDLNYVLLICLPYLIIGIGISGKFPGFDKLGDYSYGVYIYAFSIQQTLVYLFKGGLTVFSFFAYSFLITIGVAILSWHYLERPALKLKRYFEQSV